MHVYRSLQVIRAPSATTETGDSIESRDVIGLQHHPQITQRRITSCIYNALNPHYIWRIATNYNAGDYLFRGLNRLFPEAIDRYSS